MHPVTRLHLCIHKHNLCAKVCITRLAQCGFFWDELHSFCKQWTCKQSEIGENKSFLKIFKLCPFVWYDFRHIDSLSGAWKCPPCWSGVQLKGTMWWIYFIMNKAFVWGARILNGGPESRVRLWTIRSKTSQNWRAVSHSSCTSHRRPVTFVLLIVLHFFKGLAGTIGHLEAFMWRKTNVLILALNFRGRTTQGWRLPLVCRTPCYSKEKQY